MIFEEYFLESLLYEEEGVTFDVKSEQYKLSESTDEQKSELLKDILCFCNAWRRTDAYIFIGAKEIKGGKNLIIGVDHFLDDAHVQQFVNGKTQKPVIFSFVNCECQGNKISIIHIPVQERPVFLKKDYGRLKQNVVYVKRGSSSSEATPDEIAQMGRDSHRVVVIEPKLTISLEEPELKNKGLVVVTACEVVDQVQELERYQNLLISDREIELILKHKTALDQIEDRYPDGKKFYPYRFEIVQEYQQKVKCALELINNNFDEFCSFRQLYFRSFELAKTKVSEARKKSGIMPSYGFVKVHNKGTCPSGAMMIRLKSNSKIRFLNRKNLARKSFDFETTQENIANIINKANDLDKGGDPTIITLFEKVNGYSYNWRHDYITPYDLDLIANVGSPISAKINNNGDVDINVNSDLMHNISMTLECMDIYLCPMLKLNEKVEIEYEIHSARLPVPSLGAITVTA